MSLNIAFELSIPDDLERFLGDQETSDAVRDKWALYGARIGEFFHHPDCLRVTRGGYLAFQTTKASKVAQTDISHLLDLVSYLIELQPCRGFERLVANLQDSSKFDALCFEIGIGVMLLKFATTELLEIEPAVEVNGRIKHPEFAWRLKGHESVIYVECKRQETFELKIRRRGQLIFQRLSEEYRRLGNWPENSRIDIELPNGIFNDTEVGALHLLRQFSEVYARTNSASDVLESRNCIVSLHRQGDQKEWKRPAAIFYQMSFPANTVKRWAREEADLVVAIDITRQTISAANRSIETALKQLPPDAPAIIAISASTIKPFVAHLQNMLSRPSCANVMTFVIHGNEDVQYVGRTAFLEGIGALRSQAISLE